MSVTIPQPKAVDKSKITVLDQLETSPQSLKHIKSMKAFLKAQLDGGMSANKAHAISGLPKDLTSTAIMQRPMVKLMLTEMLENTHHDDRIIKKIDQLWDAEDIYFTKAGDIIKKPNWDAQGKNLDRVLKLRGYLKQEETSVITPTQIVFNVTPTEASTPV